MAPLGCHKARLRHKLLLARRLVEGHPHTCWSAPPRGPDYIRVTYIVPANPDVTFLLCVRLGQQKMPYGHLWASCQPHLPKGPRNKRLTFWGDQKGKAKRSKGRLWATEQQVVEKYGLRAAKYGHRPAKNDHTEKRSKYGCRLDKIAIQLSRSAVFYQTFRRTISCG